VALFRRSTEANGSSPVEPSPARPGAGAKKSGSSPVQPSPARPGPGAKKSGSSPLRPAPAQPAPAARKNRSTPAAPVAPRPTPPGAKKDRPTPTRREAEAARRQRVNRTLSAKESRRLDAQQNRTQRLRAVSAREAVPEKTLMRDHVDARFNLGEFLLPSLVVILALTFLASAVPRITYVTTIVMYVFLLAVLLDCYLMWRGFKRVLAERLPGTSTRGLLLYGVNRAIQIRRFRMPAPRVKRGEVY